MLEHFPFLKHKSVIEIHKLTLFKRKFRGKKPSLGEYLVKKS
ncbi:hypothetical protein UF75_5364 [Desulfosporosinus sp. I2]|nr:hypothetical protein UF75_5364 [Desulfosporosinus sp. I2]